MADLLAAPIVKFAFALLVPDASVASKAHAYRESARVSAKYIHFFDPKVTNMSETTEGLGSRLLFILFQTCEHARPQIIKNIVLRLLVATDSAASALLCAGSTQEEELLHLWSGSEHAHYKLRSNRAVTGPYASHIATARSSIRLLTRLCHESASKMRYDAGITKRA